MLDSLLDNYVVIAKIGEGSFSEVLKVKEKKTGNLLAAKKLLKQFNTLDEVKCCTELKTIRSLTYHPNVISLVDMVYEEASGTLVMMFELMDMSIYDYIKDRKRCLSETRCKHFLYQLCNGLNHLHSNGIFHRDIKPENILIKVDPKLRNNNLLRSELIQLADLGSVCKVDEPSPHSAYVSTRWYRAPECLLSPGYYGPKMDLWALGCVFFEMLTLVPIFTGENELDQLDKIHAVLGTPSEKLLEKFKWRSEKYLKHKFSKKKPVGLHNMVPMLSDHGVHLLNKMLGYHPDCRITARRIVDHIYFADLKKKSQIVNHIRLSASASKMERNAMMLGKKSTLSLSNQSIDSISSKFSMKNPRPTNSTLRKCQSLSVSRESTYSCHSTKSEAGNALKKVQSQLNKDLERAWGMNSCKSKNLLVEKVKKSSLSKIASLDD